ncbi:MAG: GDSL-type esterase/lipase family protein, partial [Planctomycetota bacterium]|nr:GDSL-type esterase/lipase family protein [Planctomycetota bacterium]
MNGKHLLGVALAAALVLGLGVQAGAGGFFFKDGDTVVVMGDSITEQHLYSNYLEAWTLMRFPAWKITFHNVGIGGDTSGGGNGRFARDVTEYKPTVLTVDFGMNDGGYGGFDKGRFDAYMAGLTGIAKQAKANKLRVAWITPSPVEKNENGKAIEGYNQTLERFCQGMKQIAHASGGLFVDQFHPCLAVQDKARATDPAKRVGGGDAVHFGPPGQAVMAAAILKGLGFPTLVAAVELDAKGKVLKSDNCKITDASAAGGGLKFTQLDQALPFFPAEAESILAFAPIRDELNLYTLKVSGLAAGKYDVKLGDAVVAQYTNVQLAAGVNLAEPALKAGPVADQVQAVWAAIKGKNQFNHDQIYRGLILNNSTDKAKIESLRDEVAKKDAEIQKLRVIAPHTVEILPA